MCGLLCLRTEEINVRISPWRFQASSFSLPKGYRTGLVRLITLPLKAVTRHVESWAFQWEMVIWAIVALACDEALAALTASAHRSCGAGDRAGAIAALR